MPVATAMHRLCHQAVDEVEALTQAYGLENARFTRCGNLRCAHTSRALDAITDEAKWMQREMGDDSLRCLSAGEVAEETGSYAFKGGVLGLAWAPCTRLTMCRVWRMGLIDAMARWSLSAPRHPYSPPGGWHPYHDARRRDQGAAGDYGDQCLFGHHAGQCCHQVPPGSVQKLDHCH